MFQTKVVEKKTHVPTNLLFFFLSKMVSVFINVIFVYEINNLTVGLYCIF